MNRSRALYQQKLTTAEEIASRLQSGDLIRSDIAAATPIALYHAFCGYVKDHDLHDLVMETSLELSPFGCYTDPAVMAKMLGMSNFSSGYARKAIARGQADFFPAYYRDMPCLHTRYRPADIFCAVAAPMDGHGYLSFGATASTIEAQLYSARRVFLEVNPNMPRTFGGPVIHISRVDALYENDSPLPVLPPTVLDDQSRAIGQMIAAEIPDGATLQLGIGAIPDAVGLALKDKRHLGIHTEMFTTSMVELMECGAVDNSCKPIHRGKSVTTFAFGTRRLYDFIDDNPAVMVMNVDYVNDVRTIARHPGMISINGAVQVDLYGQVAAESFGSRHISGTGGQADFVRGAVESEGGKSFIVFHSTTEGGGASRIQPVLEPGSIVTTSKNDVDCVATEYGIAKLRGKSVAQRARALIGIAHPKFREALTFSARGQGLLV